MSNSQQTSAPRPRAWTKPRLERIGTIADVTGQGVASAQGSSGNKS